MYTPPSLNVEESLVWQRQLEAIAIFVFHLGCTTVSHSVSYGGLILILPCLPQSEVSWLDWKKKPNPTTPCYVFHICRAITFTVKSLRYVGLPFSLPLPCSISWCMVLYVPRLPSTHSLQSAPSSVIKARNSSTGCRVLLFQFSFDMLSTLKTLLEILQTWGLSVKICLLGGKRAFFCP